MYRSFLAATLAVALAWPAFGQIEQVVPTDRKDEPGNGSFLGPLSNAVRRYQLLIDEGELTNLVDQALTGITFRLLPAATAAYPATDLTYSDYEIHIGPSVDPSLRSLTFADNRAGPQTQVRDGELVIPANSFPVGGSPQPFGSNINFDAPYVYTGGDLLIELVHSTSNGSSASTDAMLATGGAAAGYGTRFSALWTSNAAGLTGSQGNFAVMQLTAVPEPATLAIAVGGLGLLALRRRRS